VLFIRYSIVHNLEGTGYTIINKNIKFYYAPCSADGGKFMTERVSEDMVIADMLALDPGIGPILMAAGMHCIGCPASQGETLAQAAIVHDLEAGRLVDTVNEYLANK